ncbi:hypothetical protein JOS77_00825 [Chromobacterium haemolyticum]|nr:hypothetical protein JOS77_00825 [Chromobacterium haemolyticum]
MQALRQTQVIGQSQLDPPVRQGLPQLLGVAFQQNHLQLGISVAQSGQQPRQQDGRDSGETTQRHPAAQGLTDLLRLRRQILRMLQQLTRGGNEAAPGWRQRHPARVVAHEQLQTEHLFQLSDGAGHAGLRRVQRLGRRGDTAMIRHSDQISQLPQVYCIT